MKRGEIWTGLWPNDPQEKRRPLLIISCDLANDNHRQKDITVLKITSVMKTFNSSVDVRIQLRSASRIRCDQILTIKKSYLNQKIKTLTPDKLKEVEMKIMDYLDLH